MHQPLQIRSHYSIEPYIQDTKRETLEACSSTVMATHQATRAREKPSGEEEAASTLVLGDFQSVPCLTLSEARLLINVVMKHRKQGSSVKEGE